jgi:guanylate kinase
MSKKKEKRMEIMTFTGLSCSGKTWLMEKMKTLAPEKFGQPIGITTRSKRSHEVEGLDYLFVSKEEFEKLIKTKQLVSYVEYHKNYYGTLLKDVLALNEKGIIAMIPSAPDMVYEIKKQHEGKVHLHSLYLDIAPEEVTNRLKLRHFKEIEDFKREHPDVDKQTFGKFVEDNMNTFNVRKQGIIIDSQYWPHGQIQKWETTDIRIKYNWILKPEDINNVDLEAINDLYHSIKLSPQDMEYIPMPEPKKKNIKILAIVGRSASGKSTLATAVKEKYGFREAVSYTSRKPRAGEVNGVHYHFVTQDVFNQKVKDNEFVEHVDFLTSSYGLHKDEILKISKEGIPVLAVVEPNGLSQVAQYAYNQNVRATKDTSLPTWEVSAIWLDAPDHVLLNRLAKRALNDFKKEVAKDPNNEKKQEEILVSFGERWVSSNSIEQEWVYEANKIEGFVDYPQQLSHPLEQPQYTNLVHSHLKTIHGRMNDKSFSEQDILETFENFAKQWVAERMQEDDVKEKYIKFESPMHYEHRYKVFDQDLVPGIMERAIESVKDIFSKDDLDMDNIAIKDSVQAQSMINLAKKLKLP